MREEDPMDISIETRTFDQDQATRAEATHCARCGVKLAPFDPEHGTDDKDFRWLSALTDQACCSLDCAEAVDFGEAS
jgi:hypothetical protein